MPKQDSFSRWILSKQLGQPEAMSGELGETAEPVQKVTMTTMKVVSKLENTDIRSGSLGGSAMRQEMLLDKNGVEPEGLDGVSGGMGKAGKEHVLPGF
jgi:hypothetical protein